MKKIVLLFSVLFVFKTLSAQEEGVFGHYLFNPVLINPGATGFDDEHHNVFMNIRSSWTNFPGTPKTYALSYNGPVGKRLGLGAMLYTENIASITFYRAQLSYSFRYEVEDVKLSAGFSTQFNSTRIDNSDIADQTVFDQNDDLLMEAMDGDGVFDASLGFYGTIKDRYTFGFSLPNLVRARLDGIEGTDDDGPLSHFLINFGGRFDISDYKIKLEPSVLIKRVRSAPTQIDFNLVSSFLQERFITGLTYTTIPDANGEFGVILGTKYNAVRFIYSYDVHLGDFQQYNGGSHEITINFEFARGAGKFDRSKKYRKDR
ncbi:MAG: PorP/SprF family type IX secretion system membrane protein [Bacteroidota bacterium]